MMTVDELVDSARAFLDAHAARRAATDFVWGVGSDDVALLEEKSYDEQMVEVRAGQAWTRTRFDAGFGWIDGPVEYGGQGLTREHRAAYWQLERTYEVPNAGCVTIGIGMVAPPILALASDELKHAYLLGLHRGHPRLPALQRTRCGV